MNDTGHIDPLTLARWVEGSLDADEARAVAQHVAQCGRCQAEADLARDHFSVAAGEDLGELSLRLRHTFAQHLQEKMAAAVRQGVAASPARRGMARRTPPRRWFERRHLPAWLAAAAVALFAIGLHQLSTPSTAPPLPSGEMRAAERTPAIELTVTSAPDGWVVSWRLRHKLHDLRLTIEDLQGRVVGQKILDEDAVAASTLRITRPWLQERSDSRELFLRLSGLDSEERRFTSASRLLTQN